MSTVSGSGSETRCNLNPNLEPWNLGTQNLGTRNLEAGTHCNAEPPLSRSRSRRRAMFAYAPVLIIQAPYESTMGLVQKIFYFHVPSWIVMFSAAFVCGIGGASVLCSPAAARPTGAR